MRALRTPAVLWSVSTAVVIASPDARAKQPTWSTDRTSTSRDAGVLVRGGDIPTAPEPNAYNAVESYALNSGGTIAMTFRFREGGFDGPQGMRVPHRSDG